MKSDQSPWPGLEDTVRQLGESWVETRFATWMLLEQMPRLEADPSPEKWERLIPLQQHLTTVGLRFEAAAQQLADSEESWTELVADLINEMRRTLVAETEWCGNRMQLLTDRERQLPWPFPFRHAIR